VRLSWLEYAYPPGEGRFGLKVGHTDLVFGVRTGFISTYVHARLHGSVCHRALISRQTKTQTHTDRQRDRQSTAYMYSSASSAEII